MPLNQLMLALVAIWVAAKALGLLAERARQPAVLGELLAGALLGKHALGLIPDHEFVRLLADVGVVILLSEIGMETDLVGLLRMGPKSATVALVGVPLPLAGGHALARLLHIGFQAALLMGVGLSAISISLTKRTLTELGESQSPEGQIVVEAAVLDDVLGLGILGIVLGLVRGGSIPGRFVAAATAKALLFLVGTVLLGHLMAGPLMRLVDRMTVRGALETSALAVALGLAVLAMKAGSAAIIGAFAAGLVLARTHRAELIEQRLKPLASILTPIFLVTIGASLDLSLPNLLDPASRATALLGPARRALAGMGSAHASRTTRLLAEAGGSPSAQVLQGAWRRVLLEAASDAVASTDSR